jgi:hypothetical protein
MKKFLLVIFLISVLTGGLFAADSNIDISKLEKVSLEEIEDDAVIYETGDNGTIIIIDGEYYIYYD